MTVVSEAARRAWARAWRRVPRRLRKLVAAANDGRKARERNPLQISEWLDVVDAETGSRPPEHLRWLDLAASHRQQRVAARALWDEKGGRLPRAVCERQRQRRAARVIQRHVGQQVRQRAATRLQVMLRRRTRRRDLAARLVQWTWRRRHLLPARGVRWPIIWPIPRCLWGENLATDAEFSYQRAIASEVLDHYKIYMDIYPRLAKEPVVIGDLMCSCGGQSTGIEQMGGIPRGADIIDQPEYRARFGNGSFVQADATLPGTLRKLDSLSIPERYAQAKGLQKPSQPVQCMGFVGSPPCQSSSYLPNAGGGLTPSKEPLLLANLAEHLVLLRKSRRATSHGRHKLHT